MFTMKAVRKIALVVHNVRSAHNVGSILRSCEGLGINKVYLSGYTPYPSQESDQRLPHESVRIDKQIQKTALGAEKSLNWAHEPDINELIGHLSDDNYQIVALEQTKVAIKLRDFKPSGKIALVCGSEVGGLDKSILEKCDVHVQIPMLGKKESFNVAVASAIALYHLRYA